MDLITQLEVAIRTGSADLAAAILEEEPQNFIGADWPELIRLAQSHYPPRPDLVEPLVRTVGDILLSGAIEIGSRAALDQVLALGLPLDGYRAVLEAIRTDQPNLLMRLIGRGAPLDDGNGTTMRWAGRHRAQHSIDLLAGWFGMGAAISSGLQQYVAQRY